MAGNPWLPDITSRSLHISPSSLSPHTGFPSSSTNLLLLARRPSTARVRLRASSGAGAANASQQQPSSSSETEKEKKKKDNPLAVLMETPRTIWRQALRPLGDFGFGRRSVWEGGVGLFMVSGAALFALAMVWLRGYFLRSQFRKYRAVFEFSQAAGICVGTPVRIRGVTVGNVIGVYSSLRCIDAMVEIEDEKIVIPRNSLVEVNQSGLLMDTLIDITPRYPLPRPSVGPLCAECTDEGLIVCDRERIKGQQGVSLDALVGIVTRLCREMEEIGVSRTYDLVEKVAVVVLEAQPLLAKIEAMTQEIQPLLSKVCDSTLLSDVESLTKNLADATEDLRTVQSTLLSPESSDIIKKSISTLVFTLKNIESITSDVSCFTGDEATRRNLKLLIKSLSRLL